MARPSKLNIISFPFDVDFFDQKLIVRIAGEYGVKGEIIAIKLLCAVYKKGYFIKWSIDERALLIRYLPGISPELLDQVLQRLLKWGFFDEDLFRSAGVLTSVEIQKNYFYAIRRRAGLDRDNFIHLLIDPSRPFDVSGYKTGVSATETRVSVYNNSDFSNKNYNNGSRNHNNGSQNPIEVHFASQKEFLHTETGVSVNNNSDSCKQKPKGSKNNNSKSATKNGVSVYHNPDIVNKNDEIDDNNSDFDRYNPINILYNNNSSSCSSRSSCSSKTREQKNDFGEQKGEKSYQEFDKAINELKAQQIWRDSICKNNQIGKEEFEFLLEKYSDHCKSEGNINHSSLQDIKKHFNRWIPFGKQNLTNIKNQNYGSDDKNQNKRDRRRGTPANCEKEKDYYASF